MEEPRRWEPEDPGWRELFRTALEFILESIGTFWTILESIGPPWSLFRNLLGLLAGGPTVGARRTSPVFTLESVFGSLLGSLGIYSGIYCPSLESILGSTRAPWRRPDNGSQETQPGDYRSGLPWSQFWNLLRLLGRVPAVGARRPSLATIVQDSLGVYPGVYWSHGLYSGIYWDLLDYSGVYWVSLESIQESIGAPSRRPDSGSHESQPGAHRLARTSSLAPWSLF